MIFIDLWNVGGDLLYIVGSRVECWELGLWKREWMRVSFFGEGIRERERERVK